MTDQPTSPEDWGRKFEAAKRTASDEAEPMSDERLDVMDRSANANPIVRSRDAIELIAEIRRLRVVAEAANEVLNNWDGDYIGCDMEPLEMALRQMQKLTDRPWPLRWLDAPPDEPGYWWWRGPHGQGDVIMYITEHDNGELSRGYIGTEQPDGRTSRPLADYPGQWAGPIPKPVEAE